MRKVEHLLKNFLSRKSIFHKSVLLHRPKNSTAQEKLRDIQKPNAGIVLRLWLFQFDWHFFRWNRKLQINTLSTYLGVHFISPWMNYKRTREKHISSILLLWFSKMERFQALIQAIFRKHCHFPTWSQGWKKYIPAFLALPPSCQRHYFTQNV